MKINKQKGFIVLSFVFFCLIINVNASTKYIVLQDAVNIRKGPGTNYGAYLTGKLGSKYYLNSENKTPDTAGSCDGGWYEINYNNASAYVCSDYVKVYDEGNYITDNVVPTTACEIELKEKGFTSTYFKPLCQLKETHPTWTFEPIKTGLDFNVVVSQESKCGKSYIETKDANYIDSSCKSIYSSSSIWKPASYGAVRYYIDPRNFLDEKSIFMFETLSYMDALSNVYPEAVASVLKNAAFYKYHLNINNNLSTIINQAGKELNVSPTFISSRIIQELGASSSLHDLYSGVYPGYEGYYNFYNIGVTDSCANSKGTTACGLETAKSNGWYGLNNAIKGGVLSISKYYIQANQNTRYLQKFNVSPLNSNIYTHQYMTNIRAPYGEASTAYNSYKNNNALNASFSFSIPVYENMPSATSLPTNPNDNVSNGADGSSNSAPSTSTLAPNSIITSSGYKVSGKTIFGINPETTVNDVKNALESVAGTGAVEINSKTENIGTGSTITITGSTKETYTIIIYGDISGDGIINSLDLLMVRRHILKAENLKDVYYSAADINKDGAISSFDLLLVQRHILKAESIKQ